MWDRYLILVTRLAVPPLFLFSAASFCDDMMSGTPDGSVGLVAESE